MDQGTTQFVYKTVTLIVGLFLLACMIIVGGVVLRYGDGEAIKIADTLTPWVLSMVGSLAAFVLGHQVASASIARTGGMTAGGAQPTTVDAVPAAAHNVVDMSAEPTGIPQPATSGL